MNRNVSIVVALLVVVVIAGYLVWLRSKVQQQSISPKAEEQTQSITATPEPTIVATPSVTPEGKKEATSSMKPKISTPSSVKK